MAPENLITQSFVRNATTSVFGLRILYNEIVVVQSGCGSVDMRDHAPLAEPTIDAFQLSTALARLGLDQYEERLRENGFEDWETVTAITETDMAEMNFKRGDRRKLQRAIREYSSADAPHRVYEAGRCPLPPEGLHAIGEHSEAKPRPSQQAARTTRPYRRHPRPDPNASHKPKTAYVLFGEHVRQDPALSHSSFTEIAKETGKRWKELSHEERMVIWETPAADRLRDTKRSSSVTSKQRTTRVTKHTWKDSSKDSTTQN